jgi:hypothetical protein
MRRAAISVATLALVLIAGPAWACAGLVAPNGAVELVRTTTLSAYHDGVEHYVTSFEFTGAEGKFGSIVPLPGNPTDIAKAGQWTLQRLQLEVQPPVLTLDAAAFGAGESFQRAQVLQTAQVGALDLTVLKGGGSAVARWAEGNGFSLTPDAPEVLDFYANRSPIFMAVEFDADRASRQGLEVGDGTPIHLTIPTDDPWVPLRILALGAPGSELVEADIFLLTEQEPAILPAPLEAGAQSQRGILLRRSEPASRTLLTDLRGDRGMRWLPKSGMWLSFLQLNERAEDLVYDLAIDASGLGEPSPVDAGFELPTPVTEPNPLPVWITVGLIGALVGAALVERRRAARAA